MSYSALSPSTCSFSITLFSVSTLNRVFEALAQPKWKEAMEEGMQVLEKNNTLDIVDLLRDKEPIGCKWAFMVK